MIKKLVLTITIVAALALSACSSTSVQVAETVTETPYQNTSSVVQAATTHTTDTEYIPVSVEVSADDLEDSWNDNAASHLYLNGSTVTLDGSGALIDDTTVTITSAGTYVLSGTLDGGQIVVNARESGTIRLVLDDADITCTTGAPIYVQNADKVIITLADDTANYITDGDTYIFNDPEETEPNAAVFSKSDLTINGNGSLLVTANYNNGIQSKDSLIVTGGTIIVTAVNDGLKGKDCVVIGDGDVMIEAGNDGIQSTSDSDPEKGYVAVLGGTLDISAENDGIQAATNILVIAGDIVIQSGGGSQNASTGSNWGVWGQKTPQTSSDSTGSAKGLKAALNITVTGGSLDIDSSDDSVHSNDSIAISGGTINLASGDDGIHADSAIVIDGGTIDITKSYEGIESSTITINNGVITVMASDDGINGSGGADGSSVNGRPGQNMFSESGNAVLSLNGGDIYVNASGDGIDINGSIVMTGGRVIVDGPTNDGNGALDYTGGFQITGGFFIAAGSAGMAQAPDTSSTQNAIMIKLTSSFAAGTLFHIESEDGETILTFTPAKTYESIVFSSPDLEKGETYRIYTGGSVTGSESDGVYSGTYTPGTLVTELTLNTTVTTYGSSGGMMPGGMVPGTRPTR